jgi:membrane-associated phospholipid phosphatase
METTCIKSLIFVAETIRKLKMKGICCLLLALCLFVPKGIAQNWDINTLHKVNSWDGNFVRNYNKIISRTEPYVAVGVPVAMALAAWIKNDKNLLKDAVYVGTSVAGAFVVTYGMKYLVDRQRPYDRYPDRVHAYSHESSPSFPSGHTATAFALATSLSVKYPKWYVIAPSALWACSVGVSRMNEGVHYPSDVLAGAFVGAGCAVANIYINRWLNRWLFGD